MPDALKIQIEGRGMKGSVQGGERWGKSEIKEEGELGERSVDPYPGSVIHGEQGGGVIAWCRESETQESG